MMKCLLIGGSAGSLGLVSHLLQQLEGSHYAIVVVLHLPLQQNFTLADTLANGCERQVLEAEDKCSIKAGCVYVAPGGYHLYIEPNECFSLSLDEEVSFCRPSIDVLFSSAADVYEETCCAVLLSGANHDGVNGMQHVQNLGGITVAQLPDDAEFPLMPQAAIDAGCVKHVEKNENLAIKINEIVNNVLKK